MTNSEPWSSSASWGWEPTVEAAPDDVLVSTLLPRTEQLEQARAWCVALEQRIEAIRRLHGSSKYGWCVSCALPSPCPTVRVASAELVVADA